MIRVQVPRAEKLDYSRPGPWWWPFNKPKDATEPPAPLIRCPEGHLAFLSGHRIRPDGTVNPSVVCPEEACSWHVWANLEGWDQGWRLGER